MLLHQLIIVIRKHHFLLTSPVSILNTHNICHIIFNQLLAIGNRRLGDIVWNRQDREILESLEEELQLEKGAYLGLNELMLCDVSIAFEQRSATGGRPREKPSITFAKVEPPEEKSQHAHVSNVSGTENIRQLKRFILDKGSFKFENEGTTYSVNIKRILALIEEELETPSVENVKPSPKPAAINECFMEIAKASAKTVLGKIVFIVNHIEDRLIVKNVKVDVLSRKITSFVASMQKCTSVTDPKVGQYILCNCSDFGDETETNGQIKFMVNGELLGKKMTAKLSPTKSDATSSTIHREPTVTKNVEPVKAEPVVTVVKINEYVKVIYEEKPGLKYYSCYLSNAATLTIVNASEETAELIVDVKEVEDNEPYDADLFEMCLAKYEG